MKAKEVWSNHPNFPAQTLLLASHENFRRISRFLIEQAEQDRPLSGIGSLYSQWIAAMRSHEAYEEHKLYPYLARRWRISFAEAEAGHRALHDREVEVRAALKAGAAKAVAKALGDHHETLLSHLDLEESLVILPLLDLSRSEFDEYANNSIGYLMARLEERGFEPVTAPA